MLLSEDPPIYRKLNLFDGTERIFMRSLLISIIKGVMINENEN